MKTFIAVTFKFSGDTNFMIIEELTIQSAEQVELPSNGWDLSRD